jgi:PhnB protein
MDAQIKPVPEGYHSLTPYLVVHDGTAALDFYARAFGAVELLRIPAPGGKIGHAEMRVGDSPFMLADENQDMGFRSPKSLGGNATSLLLYVADVDTAFPLAIASGARILRPVADQFYGDRAGTLEDPFGHVWTLATHKEDLSPEELSRRAAACKD